MRQLYCPHCRTKIFFEDKHCLHCNTSIAFDLHHQTMQETAAVTPCANRTLIGCNWSAGSGEAFCQSCRLTRIIPTSAPIAMSCFEAHRNRQAAPGLRPLQNELPIAIPGGPRISFDFLSDETAGHAIMTGHLAGLITLNLTEADDAEREARRVAFREPYRTLLGHFRHEVGHFYWEILVDRNQSDGPVSADFRRPDPVTMKAR